MRHILSATWVLVLALCAPGVWAASYTEGKHYKRLPSALLKDSTVQSLRAEDSGKIQVIEFFSYGCHWCHGLDDDVVTWAADLPADVAVRRVPVIFQPSWRPLAKAYYTLEALDSLDKVHAALFDAVHDDRIDLSSDEKVRDFLLAAGLPKQDFDAVYQSFSINTQMQKSNTLMGSYQVMSIPLFAVHGKSSIFITDEADAGSPAALFEVLEHLIAQERSSAI